MATDFEKLGVFYLGKTVDPATRQVTDELVLYDSRHLTTHAVCVGMTGSGKTGLCIALLEEAAIDGVPAIVIDPKGDLGNLLLTFPDLSAADFAPWVDDGEAARSGLTAAALAERTATRWREGLSAWGEDGDRIRRLRAAADFSIYTPGSSAGKQLSVLRSFSAPPAEIVADADAFRERVAAAASGLLGLLGVDADPLRSREHVLLASVLDAAWREGRSLDMAGLVREVQSPPFQRVGVVDLESFFPAKDRFALAMQVNALLASPSFGAWLEGEPLDVARLLWTPEGKPRVAVLSIAHLSDAERMFFVTLLLSEIVTWMRGQAGTGSLRALLYMDEVFGYLPPVANPPSKKPLLTLLKQARACGLGVVLATQNPVDLDYKALSNAGTWLIGRLQTERDVARVIDGLEGASTAAGKSFDRGAMQALIGGLSKRVFLMNDVHEDEPTLLHARWALSYLAGPLTRQQIQRLSPRVPGTLSPGAPVEAAPAAKKMGSDPIFGRPVMPPGVGELFVARRAQGGMPGALVYRAQLLARARLHHVSAKEGVDAWRDVGLLAAIPDAGEPSWADAEVVDLTTLHLATAPEDAARFAAIPSSAAQAKTLAGWGKDLSSHLYQSSPLTLLRCAAPEATSKPGESEGEFRGRLTHLAKEERDRMIDEIRDRALPKVQRLEERIRTAETRVRREEGQYSQHRTQAAISVGATILGAIFGRRSMAGSLGRATTALRGTSRAAEQKDDISDAQGSVEALRQQLAAVEAEVETQVQALGDRLDPAALVVEPFDVAPRKADISVAPLSLAWTPWLEVNGLLEPA